MKAYNFNILVEKVKKDVAEQKIGKFVITGEKDDDYDTCKVISVGGKVVGIAEGDTLLIRPNAGHNVKIDDSEYTVIIDSDVLVIL